MKAAHLHVSTDVIGLNDEVKTVALREFKFIHVYMTDMGFPMDDRSDILTFTLEKFHTCIIN
jgi:hypothetical protein